MEKNAINNFNTVIVLNLKKKKDKGFFNELGQIDPYRLDERFIIEPPVNSIDSTDKLKIHIRLNIDKPRLLTLGFSEFYISPGDSLDINYEVLQMSTYKFRDTIRINNGNTFFTKYNAGFAPPIKSFLNDLESQVLSSKTQGDFNKLMSPKNILAIADRYWYLMVNEFPRVKQDSLTSLNLKRYCLNWACAAILGHLNIANKNGLVKKALTNVIQANVDSMVMYLANRRDPVNTPDHWLPWFGAYLWYKEAQLDYKTIMSKFSNCNDTVKQYIMLRCLKDGGLFKDPNKENIALLTKKINYPPFKIAALKYVTDPDLGSEIARNLNSIVRNTEIYDFKGNTVRFFELFKNAKRPYILFDFCGTWCKPCLDEFAMYTSQLDTFTKVEPVWLFFENDMSKWLSVINEYHLKKENCYMVLGREFISEFGKNFSWEGDFPHHFLFEKDGKIIDNKFPSLTELDESKLPVK